MSERRRHALLVAVGTYEDDTLRGLRAPRRDATDLARVLGDPAIGDFSVEVLDDPGAHELRRRVEDFFADRMAADTLLLHFACHGLKDEGGKLFLAASDTMHTRLESTAIPAEYVSRLMMRSRAGRAAVLLDCCYAGAFERGMFSRADTEVHVEDNFTALERVAGERGRAVLTASSAVEYAFEGSRVVAGEAAGSTMEAGPLDPPGPSLFTGALVEGLRTGEADLGGDGDVGLAELAEYIGQQVRAVTPNQNPQLWMFGAHGDLVIARAARRDGTLLPGAPLARAESAEPEQRLWAVADLQAVLEGPDPPVALAALAALRRLAEDDSRRVSEAARQSLAAVAPRIAQTHWDLGVTPAGQSAAEIEVPVLGPPVVRAHLKASADGWVRVRPIPQGLALSAFAKEPGVREARVDVRTATGELTLTVRAEIIAPLAGEADRSSPGEPGGRNRGLRLPAGLHAGAAALLLAAAAVLAAGVAERALSAVLAFGVLGATAACACAALSAALWRGARQKTADAVLRWSAVEAGLCTVSAVVLGVGSYGFRVDFLLFGAGTALHAVATGTLLSRALRRRWLLTRTSVWLAAALVLALVLLQPDVKVGRFDRPRGNILVQGHAVTGSEDTGGTLRYRRTYTDGKLYAPVTGHASQALEKFTGLEDGENDVLAATRAAQHKGGDILTTINAAAQKAGYDGLGGRQGAVVALDPGTGAVLALVSTPSYDPSAFAGNSERDRAAYEKLGKDPQKPLLNRALDQLYPPGAAFEVITAAAALEHGLYTNADEATNSPASWTLPGAATGLKNSDGTHCTNASLRQALRYSCDVVFGKISVDLPQNAIMKEAKKFGFGKSEWIKMSTAVSVYPEDTLALQNGLAAIGQYDNRATPFQMARVAAAIADDGSLKYPYLVQEAPVGSDEHGTEEEQRPLSQKNARSLQSMMETVVEGGTARNARITGVTVGGKTGSAQNGVKDMAKPYSWFIGYAKAAEGTPPVAVAVVVEDEDASQGDSPGGGLSASIARKVMEAVLKKQG
ncbi:penicillin-binding transpeptidase domain-containing protein [Streptomyces sp. NPDC001401]|uniref:caspase, EACC1-associated type n=1 Tax=Streptomyces sp. NPDC001401 TaxID=3364570 RepID=UPI0036BAF30E